MYAGGGKSKTAPRTDRRFVWLVNVSIHSANSAASLSSANASCSSAAFLSGDGNTSSRGVGGSER